MTPCDLVRLIDAAPLLIEFAEGDGRGSALVGVALKPLLPALRAALVAAIRAGLPEGAGFPRLLVDGLGHLRSIDEDGRLGTPDVAHLADFPAAPR